MEKSYTAETTTTINAPTSKVWQGLTDPALVKQYFFGVDLITDWKVGSPIIYRGTWEGEEFEDKGTVLAFEPEKLLITSYWSPFSGLPDSPENYQKVTYILEPSGEATKLTVTQEGNKTEEAKNKSEQNWNMVLDNLKQLLEK